MSKENTNLYRLVLGSQSPRRKELLGWLKVPFQVCPASIDEQVRADEVGAPQIFVERLASEKARACLSQLADPLALVVASDTTVALGERILNKPANRQEAREMLLSLSGRTHQVYTAVAIKTKERERVFCVRSEVSFAPLTEDILNPYLDSGDSLDKAGAYGIQGMGLTFVQGVQGSYSNVVGFPLVEFIEELKKFVTPPGEESSTWRQRFVQTL